MKVFGSRLCSSCTEMSLWHSTVSFNSLGSQHFLFLALRRGWLCLERTDC